jgi:hypothetical protein
MAIRFTRHSLSFVSSFDFLKFYPSNDHRDCFQDCARRNIWGGRKIILMDTTFWDKLTTHPDRYRDGFKEKNNLLDCDFAVIPMFKT